VPFNAKTPPQKQLSATPFKRPENGQFRPGTNFSEFIFDTTGDTNALTEAGVRSLADSGAVPASVVRAIAVLARIARFAFGFPTRFCRPLVA